MTSLGCVGSILSNLFLLNPLINIFRRPIKSCRKRLLLFLIPTLEFPPLKGLILKLHLLPFEKFRHDSAVKDWFLKPTEDFNAEIFFCSRLVLILMETVPLQCEEIDIAIKLKVILKIQIFQILVRVFRFTI